MAKRIIEIEVNDEYVLGSGVVIGAAGADESVILRVAFNDTWAGLNIYATFRDSMGESPTIMMLMPSMLVPGETMKYDVVVPAAATAVAGKMCLVFSGFAITQAYLYAKNGDTVKELVYRDAVINTANAYFRVLPSDFSALDVEDHAEVTVLEQVLGEINAFRGELDEHESEVASAIQTQNARIGDLGTYTGSEGEAVPYTVEGRLAAQDTKLEAQDEVIGNFKKDCDDGKYTVGIAAIEKKTPAQYINPGEANYCVDTYLIRLTNGKEHSFTVKNGSPFTVARIYSSVAEMNDGFSSDGVPQGGFVVIDTGNVEDEDNARLYVKGSAGYAHITDLSGTMGIQGPKGDAYVITEDDKAEIAGKIENEYFGDINSALDVILAIQEALIPKPIITFTIGGIEYTAIEGMTWQEWCDSEYNTIDAYCPGGGIVNVGLNEVRYNDYSNVSTSEKIKANENYILFA